jgi:hypothetical protein
MNGDALEMLAQEARALLTRLKRIKPFALHETAVPAASISPNAQIAIERYLADGRKDLRQLGRRSGVRGPGCPVVARILWRLFGCHANV